MRTLIYLTEILLDGLLSFGISLLIFSGVQHIEAWLHLGTYSAGISGLIVIAIWIVGEIIRGCMEGTR